MNMIKWILLLYFSTLISACGNDDNNEQNGGSVILQQDFVSFLDSHGKNIEDYSFIMVLPNVGCDGCITNGEKFFIENVKENSDHLYIFTTIKDLKIFKQSHLWAYSMEENVIIDVDNTLYQIGFYSYTPCLIELTGDEFLTIKGM